MKALIIANPHAHWSAGPLQAAWQREDYRRQAKNLPYVQRVEWADTAYPGHAAWLAQEAAENGYAYVLAAGGDGTVNEVLNGLMRAPISPRNRPIMGVLPCGTCNDFHAALKQAEQSRIPDGSNGVHFSIDIGRVVFDDMVRYFCLSVAIGLLSWANQQYLECSRIFGRRFAHLPAGLRTVLTYQRVSNIRIVHDTATVQRKKVLSIAISNCATVAGGRPLSPGACLNDGQFDVLSIAPVSLPRLLWLALKISRGVPFKSQHIHRMRTHDITIQSDQPFPIHIDGELIPELNSRARFMHVKVMPAELKMLLPSALTSPLPFGKDKAAGRIAA